MVFWICRWWFFRVHKPFWPPFCQRHSLSSSQKLGVNKTTRKHSTAGPALNGVFVAGILRGRRRSKWSWNAGMVWFRLSYQSSNHLDRPWSGRRQRCVVVRPCFPAFLLSWLYSTVRMEVYGTIAIAFRLYLNEVSISGIDSTISRFHVPCGGIPSSHVNHLLHFRFPFASFDFLSSPPGCHWVWWCTKMLAENPQWLNLGT